MKYILLTAIIISMTSFKKKAGNNADRIIGKWVAAKERNLIVSVSRTGDEFKAAIVWFDNSDDKTRPMSTRCDIKNHNENMRGRKVIGLEVLRGLTYNEKEHEWQNGHIYDPSSGNEYNAKAWLTQDGHLEVRGYWHFEVFGQTILFVKAF